MSFLIPKKPQILYAPMLASFGGGSARGFNPGGGGAGSLSAITFTVGGNNGFNGPVIGDLSYGTRSDLVALNFSVDSTGIQSLDVPEVGTYNYTIEGASAVMQYYGGTNSSNYGRGAVFSGTLTIGSSDVGKRLFIAVGQLPANPAGWANSYSGQLGTQNAFTGGGGGTFLSVGPSLSGSSAIIVAGGGGSMRAGYTGNQTYTNASISFTGNGNPGKDGGVPGGTNGNGGYAMNQSDQGTAGSGFSGRGDPNVQDAVLWGGLPWYSWSARPFTAGAQGSKANSLGSSVVQPSGGFGGGGAGGWGGSAGGGGYSGGGGGTNSGVAQEGHGGGGGNYRDTNRVTTIGGSPAATRSGPGTLTLSKV